MKNIAYIIDTMSCDTAGTQKQLLETIRRLDRDRFVPHLICLWESPWMRSGAIPCPVHVLGYRGFLKRTFPATVRDLGRLLDTLDIHLLHAYFDEAIFVGWMGARLARRRPVLLSSRRDMGLGVANQPWYHRMFPHALRIVNRDFAAIIANSEQIKLYAAKRERTPLSKYVVLPNGVELPAPVKRPPAAVSDVARIGIVASLTPVKRHDVLLDAWARLEKATAPGRTELVLIGDGPERHRLEAQAAELGIAPRVQFVGAVTDVGHRLDALDIGVLCSDREGLSNAILEYMAHGLPVVATAVGGTPELIGPENGLLVPPSDPAALASALRQLVDDPVRRRAMGDAAASRIRATFSWERSIADLMAWYDSLV
ncbi:MAG: glycosyltransferase [bacterium]|nr:glycosyltransferase [bacterium]